MKILVTGGAGYIGSHFVKKLISQGKQVVVFDNLSRGHIESISENVSFENVDLVNKDALRKCLTGYEIEAVVHFASFAYVGESVENPGLYYKNNVVGSLNLIDEICRAGINKFIFSSTCSVYGNDNIIPIKERENVAPINPYANSKLMIEKILADYNKSKELKYVALRYFNAAGADPDGEIGESHDPEPHLIPNVLNTALGLRNKVSIYGDNYNTKDGTCVRDYIHVCDLADAHLASIDYLYQSSASDPTIINLGTGIGYSVREIIETAEEVSSNEIPYEIRERRAGDPDILVADNQLAKNLLHWKPKYGLKSIVETAWNWHQNKKF
ncbi:MAG: UDP-glucose 4-epimerase GalE [Ignavibacterium sp.]|nr:MAG: UDP-glucose 4-epimerase GalE [Ignavibacterium sp.]